MIPVAMQSSEAQAVSRSVEIAPVLKTEKTAAGQPITLPSGPVEVSAAIYRIGPHARLPMHKHPAVRYGFILEGELTVTLLQTGKSQTYGKGDFIVEAIDAWHSAENTGAVEARLLVIDQTRKGAVNVLVHPARD